MTAGLACVGFIFEFDRPECCGFYTALTRPSIPQQQSQVMTADLVCTNCLSFIDLSAVDSAWYTALTSPLTPQQQSQVEEIFKLADQRKAASG